MTSSTSSVSDVNYKKVGHFLLGSRIAEGSFGEIRMATHTATKDKVAIKVVCKRSLVKNPTAQRNFRREIVLLQRVRHANIARLYETLETNKCYYLVLELVDGGNLLTRVTESGHLTEEETQVYVRLIASALEHLHNLDIVHRNLTLDNLMLERDNNIKLVGCGLIARCQGNDLQLSTRCSNPLYAAPELFTDQKYGKPVDVWSLGVCMFAMLVGRLPFYPGVDGSMTELWHQVVRGCDLPGHVSSACSDLLARMLEPVDSLRIKFSAIVAHPWLASSDGLPIKRMVDVSGSSPSHVGNPSLTCDSSSGSRFSDGDVITHETLAMTSDSTTASSKGLQENQVLTAVENIERPTITRSLNQVNNKSCLRIKPTGKEKNGKAKKQLVKNGRRGDTNNLSTISSVQDENAKQKPLNDDRCSNKYQSQRKGFDHKDEELHRAAISENSNIMSRQSSRTSDSYSITSSCQGLSSNISQTSALFKSNILRLRRLRQDRTSSKIHQNDLFFGRKPSRHLAMSENMKDYQKQSSNGSSTSNSSSQEAFNTMNYFSDNYTHGNVHNITLDNNMLAKRRLLIPLPHTHKTSNVFGAAEVHGNLSQNSLSPSGKPPSSGASEAVQSLPDFTDFTKNETEFWKMNISNKNRIPSPSSESQGGKFLPRVMLSMIRDPFSKNSWSKTMLDRHSLESDSKTNADVGFLKSQLYEHSPVLRATKDQLESHKLLQSFHEKRFEGLAFLGQYRASNESCQISQRFLPDKHTTYSCHDNHSARVTFNLSDTDTTAWSRPGIESTGSPQPDLEDFPMPVTRVIISHS